MATDLLGFVTNWKLGMPASLYGCQLQNKLIFLMAKMRERERERERDRRNLLVVGDESSNIIRKKEIESESKEGWGGSKFVEFEEKKRQPTKMADGNTPRPRHSHQPRRGD